MSSLAILPTPIPRESPLDPLARRVVFGLLAHLGEGELTVVEGQREYHFGRRAADGLAARVDVRAPHAYAAILRGGVGLARAYADRLWETDDPAAVVRLLCRNLDGLDALRCRVQPLLEPVLRLRQTLEGWNTRPRIRRRVRAHYDIGNDLFTIMLGSTMAYSCAVFPRPDADLDEASTHKFDLICRKLALLPSDHVLEIGGGWGGFAIHAASRYGCRVTTTTISREQARFAREWVHRAGVEDRVTVLEVDYRDLTGRYSKIVSIEMIEAIGWRYFDTFFARCAALLEPDGAMLLQAIVTSPRLYRQWRLSHGFANSVIFPGGCLPSVEVMLDSIARTGGLRMVHLEDITDHYPRTLLAWRERFLSGRHQLDPERYDDRFARLWEFYLAYCAGAFAERRIRDVQMLLVGPRFRDEATLLRQTADAEPRLSGEPLAVGAGTSGR